MRLLGVVYHSLFFTYSFLCHFGLLHFGFVTCFGVKEPYMVYIVIKAAIYITTKAHFIYNFTPNPVCSINQHSHANTSLDKAHCSHIVE